MRTLALLLIALASMLASGCAGWHCKAQASVSTDSAFIYVRCHD